MGFFGWLTLSFIILKLIGYIDWNWLMVISPIFIGGLFVVSLAVAKAYLETAGNKKDRDVKKALKIIEMMKKRDYGN